MKTYLLLLSLLFVYSCKEYTNNIVVISESPPETSNKVANSYIVAPYYEPIDTTEFMVYWKQFRRAVLNHDTLSLSPMIDDYLVGDCLWYIIDGYGEHMPIDLLTEFKLPPSWNVKNLHKSFFLDRIDSLFTSAYLSLLKEYDIKKDLGSGQKKSIPNRYVCRNLIDKKTYSASIDIQNNRTVVCNNGIERLENTAIYFIGYEEDSGPIYNFTFELGFVKTSKGIKLHRIGYSYNHMVIE